MYVPGTRNPNGRTPQENANLIPYRKGQVMPGQRFGAHSPERRALYRAIEANEIPKVLTMLSAIYRCGIEGDMFAAKLWLDQVRGTLKPRSLDDDQIDAAVDEKLMEMLSTMKRRKEEAAAAAEHPPVVPNAEVIPDPKANGAP